MSQLTAPRDTPKYGVSAIPEFLFDFTVEAGSAVYQGSIVGLNAAGNAVPAAAVDCKVVGVAQETKHSGERVRVRQGCHRFANAAGQGHVSKPMVGSACFVADDQTVAAQGSVKAGTIVGVDDAGVWVQFLLGS